MFVNAYMEVKNQMGGKVTSGKVTLTEVQGGDPSESNVIHGKISGSGNIVTTDTGVNIDPNNYPGYKILITSTGFSNYTGYLPSYTSEVLDGPVVFTLYLEGIPSNKKNINVEDLIELLKLPTT